jgi:isopenicillin-N epimerase
LLFFSHVLSPTGMVLPAQEVCDLARRHGILTVVDGAHAPAMIPLHVESLNCDFYTGNCHKWLLAPTGAGFLYLGKGNEDRLQPMQVSWGWHYDKAKAHQRDDFGSTPHLRSLEFEGTRDPCPWLAVPTAIDFQGGLGSQQIRDRIEDLTSYVRERIGSLPGLSPATPTNARLRGAMTAFRLPAATDVSSLRKRLWEEHRIEAPIIEKPGGSLLRISTHFYNTEPEIDRLATAMTGTRL